ncbi:hypothetical protein KVT40_006163 [Elsinoe batatas]|uniref:Uncharacterized protein n=1 Tax=Elsinoe batatas TaxID=2601811 RepID=A0A8K0KYJ6_9PEZI|nr:hypothetical protein KVT40_006163 [Elsinoe batatas]
MLLENSWSASIRRISRLYCRDSTGYTCSIWMLSSFRCSNNAIPRPGHWSLDELPTLNEFIHHVKVHGGQDWFWDQAMAWHDPRRIEFVIGKWELWYRDYSESVEEKVEIESEANYNQTLRPEMTSARPDTTVTSGASSVVDQVGECCRGCGKDKPIHETTGNLEAGSIQNQKT